MPILDKPLAELHNYQGINPKPADFDSFWDNSLEELRAIPPAAELCAAPFQVPAAECFDLFFIGTGGSRIHAKLLRPKHISRPAPAIILYHGLDCSSGDWSDKLGYVSQGFVVAALDCRGQGYLSEDSTPVSGYTLCGHICRGLDDRPEKLLYRQIFLDAAQLVNIIAGFEYVDEKKIAVAGGSQGGALTLAAAALSPFVSRAAACHPFLCDYKRVWEMDLAREAYDDLRRYFRKYDPLHEREAEIFEKLGYIDIQFLAPRITASVLLATGLQDEICPPSTQFSVYNKITAPKKMLIYPDFGHEWYPGYNDLAFEFLLQMQQI